MKHRHKVHKAKGGEVAYAGGNSNVEKEAEERKRGGKVKHMEDGDHGKMRHDRPKRAAGGSVSLVSKPGRARGGSVGAEKRPLSGAASIKEVTKGEESPDQDKDGKTTQYT